MQYLTKPQHTFFETFGYLHLPRLLADRIDGIIEAFEQLWSEHGGGNQGKRHDGSARSCIIPFIDQSEMLSALLDDPRIEGLAASLAGDDFNYTGSDGNLYASDGNWHSEGFRKSEVLRFF